MNQSITLSEAKELYKKGFKELALRFYSLKELTPLPRTWEEFCEQNPLKRGSLSFIFPNKKYAIAARALCQLVQLQKAWVRTKECPWSIVMQRGTKKVRVIRSCFSSPLSFPSMEQATDFLSCFSLLITQAKPLL